MSVSVVIPTYDRPDFLDGAITTAAEQTYEDIEIIVVDDGSSEEYAKKIVDKHSKDVVLYRHSENKGLSAARNTGIKNATGSYVAFLDDDDRWHRTKISRQVSSLQQNDDAGLATCLVAAITPDNEFVHCEGSALSGDCSEELLIGNRIGTPSKVLVRKEVFDDIGHFDESLPTKQDWDFYLRLCQRWRITAVKDHLCFRTIHKSMSSSNTALARDKQAILEKHEELIREQGLWDQARADVAAELGRSYLGTDNLKTAREYLKKSISLEPTPFRIILMALSYTHPWLIDKAIRIKRSIVLEYTDCDKSAITKNEIPGIYR